MRSRFGHIVKYKNGRYQAQWVENGARRSKRCSTYQEASIILAQAQLRSGQPNKTITYSEYYKGVIIPSYKNLAIRTKEEHEHSWKDLKPYISERQIKDTNWRLVQQTIDNFDAPSRQRKNLSFWKRMLNFAIKDELLDKNPCLGIKIKKMNHFKKILYTKNELKKILYFVNGTEFAIPVLLESCCGLRHEEMCALNYKDFDFRDNGWCVISVSRALTSVYGKKVLKECKNEHSERIVVLQGSFVQYLLDNSEYMPNKYSLKEYTSPIVLTRHWKKFCKENSLKYVTFGNMRSVYATLTAEAGCLDSLVSKSMGHSGGSVKEKNYQTVTIKALKLNANVFADYINFTYPKTSLQFQTSIPEKMEFAEITIVLTPDNSKKFIIEEKKAV